MLKLLQYLTSPPNITPNTDYIIPKRTPFILDVLATDSDGDDLTYNWEQFDNELGPQPPVSSSTNGPLFRGFKPTTTSLRYFPRLETILNNQLQTVWEVLPNVERSMDFVVTVRDNNILGGQNYIRFNGIKCRKCWTLLSYFSEFYRNYLGSRNYGNSNMECSRNRLQMV